MISIAGYRLITSVFSPSCDYFKGLLSRVIPMYIYVYEHVYDIFS